MYLSWLGKAKPGGFFFSDLWYEFFIGSCRSNHSHRRRWADSGRLGNYRPKRCLRCAFGAILLSMRVSQVHHHPGSMRR